MRNLVLVLLGALIAFIALRFDAIVNALNQPAQLVAYALGIVVFLDYIFGVTKKVESNSVLEAVLRGIGRVIIYVFGLDKSRYKMKKTYKL